MRKLLALHLLLLLGAIGVHAQVTATVTDGGGQTWNNGSWSVKLINAPGSSPSPGFFLAGTNTPVPGQNQTGTLSATGTLSVSLTVNSGIAPANTAWQFQVCPNASAACFINNITITSVNQVVTAFLNPPAIAINMTNPPPVTFAYADSEIINPIPGNSYYNVTSASLRTCTGLSPCVWTGGSGAGPIVLNNPAGGGANDLTLGIENQERMVCSLSAAYRFQTIVAAINDIKSFGSGGGGIIRTCPGHVETTTSQTDIGCGNEASCGSLFYTVTILMYPGTIWTCNDTAGGTDACWNIHNGSALYGLQNGAQAGGAGSANGGVKLEYACTAKTSYGVNTAEGSLTSGTGQAFAKMGNLIIEGCPSGTVAGGGSPSVALLNIEGISETNQWDNLLVDRFANTIGIRLAGGETGSTSVLGPLVLNNVWSDGGYNTGALPWKIDASLKAIIPITINGGVCNHPGPALTCMTVVGNAATGNGSLLRGLNIHGMYFENIQNGGSTMISLTSVNDVMLDHLNMTMEGSTTGSPSADTGVSIAEGSTGATSLVDVDGIAFYISGGGTATALTNSINSDSQTVNSTGSIQYMARYHYGNDNSMILPFILSNNVMQVLHASPGVLVKNLTNAENDIDCNAGLSTAGENCFIRFFDHTNSDTNTVAALGITGATHSFIISESAGNSNYAFQHIPTGLTQLNAFGTGIQLNLRANSVAPVQFGSGGAAPIEVARMDGTGNLFLGCHTTTFQNCTELSATGASGGASAAIITIPGTTGTACVSASPCSATTYSTATNCSSSASPAVCGSASAGSVALPTNATSSSIQVNTTAVTANSQIFAFADDTLGTKLGITCNSTLATLVGGLTISARTAGTSFTIANNVAVVTNALCVSYWIVN